MAKGPTLSERFAEINKQSAPASRDNRDSKKKPGVNKITNKPIVQFKPSGGGRGGRDSERGTGRRNDSGKGQTPSTRNRGPRLSRPARGGRRNGGTREKKQKLTAEDLDKELEDYKKQDAETFKASLDKELEEYSKQAAQTKKEEPAAATSATEEKKE